jgi:hypothetical protein
MDKKYLFSFVAAVIILLVLVVPAGAITYGQPDLDHPYVGLVGFYDVDGNWMWRCSGTLIAPTVLLTAGHCTSPDAGEVPARAQVWFGDQIIYEPGVGYPDMGGTMGTPIANPDYHGLYLPDTHDVGLVILDTPVENLGYGVLAPLGYLDKLATRRGLQDVLFTSVGYGLNEVKPHSISLRERYAGVAHLVNLNSKLTDGYNIQTSNNPGNWLKDIGAESGGTCFGDSGGPLFYGNSNVVVGVTSFGMNYNCKGTDFAFRVDTNSARDFLEIYVPVP